jgi:hypothetical protein
MMISNATTELSGDEPCDVSWLHPCRGPCHLFRLRRVSRCFERKSAIQVNALGKYHQRIERQRYLRPVMIDEVDLCEVCELRLRRKAVVYLVDCV